jgi:hypothetical protein
MTEQEAWEIYDAGSNKQGRPSSQFQKAKLWLIDNGKLDTDEAKTKTEKKDKKPPLELSLINNPFECSEEYQIELYMEGIKYIADKRNFDFDYYMIGRYGLVSTITKVWESNSEKLQYLRTLASEMMEHKLLDAINDKWSGGNPIGNMLTLKSKYGYSDRGDGGTLDVKGNIEIRSEFSEDDMLDIDYDEDGHSEELGYDNEDSQ